MKLGKLIHSNKGFFLLSLGAAVVGLVVSFLFGGCSKPQEPSTVIVSKRVKIDVNEFPATHLNAVSAEKTKATEKGPQLRDGVKKPHKKNKIQKSISNRKKENKARLSAKSAPSHKKRAPLKTLRKSWVLNVASFTQTSEAERLKKRLLKAGYNTYITKFRKGPTLYYRVRVGFYLSNNDAKKDGRIITSKFRDVGTPWVSKPGMDEIIRNSK